jgi:Fe-S-cluster-containing dehydrogenase component
MSTERELTFDDVLRAAGQEATRPLAERLGPPPGASYGAQSSDEAHGCGSPACGCGKGPSSPASSPPQGQSSRDSGRTDGTGSAGQLSPGGSSGGQDASGSTILDRKMDRRGALGTLFGAMAMGTQAVSACSPTSLASEEDREARLLEWEEYLKGNFRRMSDEEKAATIDRLERLSRIRQGTEVNMASTEARPGVVYGYAFNISKCQGYRNCVEACIQENNLDREAGTQYIRIFEMEQGTSMDDLDHGDATYQHQVPAEGHFYIGTQCFQCANPPCVEVCPVGATWQEPDGITVVDYDWCIGCRYCMAACPYWARRFNWAEPQVPAHELNPNQHYLGNRARKSGVVEKCTFCIQRSRQGQLPACAEACPTGARVFGNILDPNSEIRWVLENKRVFRLKEDLHTEPRFWYFMD